MRVEVGARTDIGRARQRNEDSFLVQEPLFAVADGMGGHRGGNVASSLALEVLSGPEEGFPSRPLAEAIQEANRRVLERGEADRDLRGMGTTITALVVEGERALIAHVGDSRAYRLRDGSLQQLTEDHTLVQRMVREGRLSPEEAANHPQRSIVTRALGIEEVIDVDQLTLDVQSGDRVLLCSDGLTSMVDRDRIREILEREPDPQVACDRLVDAANSAGGDDNITVILLEFREGEPDPGSGATRVIASPAAVGAGVERVGSATRADGSAPSAGRAYDPEPTGRTDVTGVMTRPEPAAAPAVPGMPPAGRGRRWLRLAVWGAVLVVLLGGGLLGARAYVNHQWYVGESSGRVAVFNGIPTQILSFKLSHVEETTALPSSLAERLEQWKKLPNGITARSLSDARLIVQQIRADLQGPTG